LDDVIGLGHLCFVPALSRWFETAAGDFQSGYNADQEHPQREDQYNPVNIAPAEQEKQRQGKAAQIRATSAVPSPQDHRK
jgi:hypothetical protein